MAYDETLVQRVRKTLKDVDSIEERKMFGGLCFMLNEHVCCGIVDDRLMARVGPKQYDHFLQKKYCGIMDFTGKPVRGMVCVEAAGFSQENQLNAWIGTCVKFVNSLPPKAQAKM